MTWSYLPNIAWFTINAPLCKITVTRLENMSTTREYMPEHMVGYMSMTIQYMVEYAEEFMRMIMKYMLEHRVDYNNRVYGGVFGSMHCSVATDVSDAFSTTVEVVDYQRQRVPKAQGRVAVHLLDHEVGSATPQSTWHELVDGVRLLRMGEGYAGGRWAPRRRGRGTGRVLDEEREEGAGVEEEEEEERAELRGPG